MKKLKTNDFLIMLCAYIAVSSFPLNYFTSSEMWLGFLGCFLRIGYIIFAVNYLAKLKIDNNKNVDKNSIIILLPVFLVCGSNLVVGLYENALVWSINFPTFYSQILLALGTAICEDILFRHAAFKLFTDKKPLERIVITSAIFGGCHLLNFFGSWNPIVFVQVIYTFGIGLILGLLYEYGGHVFPCIIFHFLFNGLNSVLFEEIYVGEIKASFYIINILFGIIVGLYCLLVYLLVLRKKHKGENSDVA